jgi:hypothetical protein
MGPARVFLFFSFILIHTNIFSQQSFWRNDSIPVIIGTDTLRNAWTGGLNFCQFSEIDLNQDGINDLFVFDRQGINGGRITTFINKGTPNQVDYVNAPEYAFKFPPLQNWALLADYNCDGKADIFSFTNGGIKIYENTSTLAGGLSFRLATPLLQSNYGTGSLLNLYVSPSDIPALVDVDGDGDLDIVTYSILTTYVEYHKNMSIEKFGRCDSLNQYVKQRYCFGGYADANVSNCTNYITQGMDSCVVSGPRPAADTTNPGGLKHSGNCILCLQEDGDKDQDIMLGHVGCTSMTEMKNTGDTSFAKFTTVDYAFPSYDIPVNLNVFPCGYLVDVDNDGKKDVLLSPNNQQEGAAEDFHSVHWYKNTGTNDSTILHFRQNNFLQDQMIDVGEGAFPSLHDYDGDGLADLFIGNYGYFDSAGIVPKIALFKNTETSTHPRFTLITRDFANLSTLLSSLHLTQFAPAFGDLDGDGDADLVIGDYQGNLYYLEKMAGAPDNYAYIPNFFAGINAPGKAATPQLIDLNRDGKLDLVIGSRNGRIYYYQNTGTATTPSFSTTPTSTTLGAVNTVKTGYTTGYAAPFFYDEAGSYKLLVGTENGEIMKFGNIDGNLGGAFTLLDPLVAYIGEGERSVPFGYDINGDGLMDMFVGNFSGGVEFYQGSTALGMVNNPASVNFDFTVFPNPASTELSIHINDYRPGEKYALSILDILGRTIQQVEVSSSEFKISVNSLPPGTYVCSLLSEKGSIHHKLLIRR